MNALVIIDKENKEYPTFLPDATVRVAPEDREAFIEYEDEGRPATARVWMTKSTFDSLPVEVRGGSEAISFRIEGAGYKYPAFDDSDITDGVRVREYTTHREFYFERAFVARNGLDSSLLEVRFASVQKWWKFKPSKRAFNVLNPAKTAFTSGAVSSASPKTLTSIVDDLVTDIGVSFRTYASNSGSKLPNTPAYHPFELVSNGVPASWLLTRALRPYAMRICYNPFRLPGSSAPGTYIAKLKVTPDAGDSDAKALEILTKVALFDGHSVGGTIGADVTADNFLPETVVVSIPKVTVTAPSVTDTATSRWLEYTRTAKQALGGAPRVITGTKVNLFVGDRFQTSTTKTYTDNLSTDANTRADDWFRRMAIPATHRVLIGAYPIDPGNHVRRVRISMDLSGLFTTVWTFGHWETEPSPGNKADVPKWYAEFADNTSGGARYRDDGTISIAAESGSGLPTGSGRYKVLQIIDDSGTPGWDYARFHP